MRTCLTTIHRSDVRPASHHFGNKYLRSEPQDDQYFEPRIARTRSALCTTFA